MTSASQQIRTIMFRLGVQSRLIPSVWLMWDHVKRYEYVKLTEGVTLTGDDVVLDLGCGRGYRRSFSRGNPSGPLGLTLGQVRFRPPID